MDRPAAVHPHLPRFSQAVTGVLCLEALVFQDKWVVAVALGLVALGRFVPRWSPVNHLFRLVARPVDELEPVSAVRFSQTLALVMLTAAFALLLGGLAVAGWVVVGLVSTVALFSAITGICVGCGVYRLALARRHRDGDVRDDLGLAGAGPWLVVLTAPGCARCEPVARQLEDIVSGRDITRIDVSRTPAAARLPVKSLPAVIAIGVDGRVQRALAGRFDRVALEAVAATV